MDNHISSVFVDVIIHQNNKSNWINKSFSTRGQVRPSGIFVARVCICVFVCPSTPSLSASWLTTRSSLNHQIWPKYAKHLGWGPYFFCLWTIEVKLNLEVQIYPFTPFWAFSHNNSSAIQARITKFGPEVHLRQDPYCFWGNWPWPSR